MKVYLAGSWSRQLELRALATELDILGIEVTSRWLYEKGEFTPENRKRYRRETALIDMQDVQAADAIVRFSDADVDVEDYDLLRQTTVKASLATGARHTEFGAAFAWGKTLIVVGGYQNVFDYLPNVIHLHDVEALKHFLNPKEPR